MEENCGKSHRNGRYAGRAAGEAKRRPAVWPLGACGAAAVPGAAPSPAASPAAQPRCHQYGYGRRDEGGSRRPRSAACGTETENSARSSAPAVRPGSSRRAPAAGEPRRGTWSTRRPQTTLIHRRGARRRSNGAPRPWARRRASARISERIARTAPRDPGRPSGADAEAGQPPRARGCQSRLVPRPPSRGAPRPPAAHPPCAGLAALLLRNGARFAQARPGPARRPRSAAARGGDGRAPNGRPAAGGRAASRLRPVRGCGCGCGRLPFPGESGWGRRGRLRALGAGCRPGWNKRRLCGVTLSLNVNALPGASDRGDPSWHGSGCGEGGKDTQRAAGPPAARCQTRSCGGAVCRDCSAFDNTFQAVPKGVRKSHETDEKSHVCQFTLPREETCKEKLFPIIVHPKDNAGGWKAVLHCRPPSQGAGRLMGIRPGASGGCGEHSRLCAALCSMPHSTGSVPMGQSCLPCRWALCSTAHSTVLMI